MSRLAESPANVPELGGRPQPLALLPFPAGFLLLPPSDAPTAAATLARWLSADFEPEGAEECPAEWRFFALAAAGDFEAALAELAAGDDLLSRANRFVLDPSAEALAALEAEARGELLLLARAAGYAHGFLGEPPEPAGGSPELQAALATARASWHLEHGRNAEARACLEAALPALRPRSPLAAAQLLGELAQLVAPESPAEALSALREAVTLAEGSGPEGPLPSLCLGLALLLHQEAGSARPALLAAIDAYQQAVHAGLSLEQNPEGYALAQANLGLAYLSLPMTGERDALRQAVAVQSFREALKVYHPERHPEAWAATQLNLANALVYLPSSHPAENLMQAVEIYESLKPWKRKELDPLGHARLLSNQAHALAHLGIFGPALAHLEEAQRLFAGHGEEELAAAVLEQVAAIHERRAAAPAAEEAQEVGGGPG